MLSQCIASKWRDVEISDSCGPTGFECLSVLFVNQRAGQSVVCAAARQAVIRQASMTAMVTIVVYCL